MTPVPAAARGAGPNTPTAPPRCSRPPRLAHGALYAPGAGPRLLARAPSRVAHAMRPAPFVAHDRRRGTHEPVRMLHIITRLIRGGADENTLATVRGLDKRRYQVDLVVGAGSELELLQGVEGIGVHIVPELVRDPDPLRDVAALFVLARLIRRTRYQVVHTHTYQR